MNDYLVRAIAFDGQLRAFALNSTTLVKKLQENHQTWPVASVALGRTATVGAMMGAMLKGNEKLTIQVNGDGPIGQVVIDANARGEVRGYVTNPEVNFSLNEKGKTDVSKGVGKGNIYVTKDLGLKEPYRGSVPIISGEIGEDFTYYFAHSEQIPSSVGVGVLINPDYSIKAAGGFIIQVLPGLQDEDITKIEEALSKIPQVSMLINEHHTPEDILKMIVGEENLKILDTMDIVFKCNCSKERAEGILIQLGKQEIEDIIEKEGKAEVTCQFCNESYAFTKDELEKMTNKL